MAQSGWHQPKAYPGEGYLYDEDDVLSFVHESSNQRAGEWSHSFVVHDGLHPAAMAPAVGGLQHLGARISSSSIRSGQTSLSRKADRAAVAAPPAAIRRRPTRQAATRRITTSGSSSRAAGLRSSITASRRRRLFCAPTFPAICRMSSLGARSSTTLSSRLS
jgi:hypothetical protein